MSPLVLSYETSGWRDPSTMRRDAHDARNVWDTGYVDLDCMTTDCVVGEPFLKRLNGQTATA